MSSSGLDGWDPGPPPDKRLMPVTPAPALIDVPGMAINAGTSVTEIQTYQNDLPMFEDHHCHDPCVGQTDQYNHGSDNLHIDDEDEHEDEDEPVPGLKIKYNLCCNSDKEDT
jgi:hypothetical protein